MTLEHVTWNFSKCRVIKQPVVKGSLAQRNMLEKVRGEYAPKGQAHFQWSLPSSEYTQVV